MPLKITTMVYLLPFSLYSAIALADNIAAYSAGLDARANNDYATSVGPYSSATAPGSSSFGYDSTAAGLNSTAIGLHSKSTDEASVAIGGGIVETESNRVGKEGIAIGNQSRSSDWGAIAVGGQSQALANTSTSIGYAATASENNATAIGRSAYAGTENSTAIGSFSTATEKDTVSVGSESIKRRITNVAPSVNDTDAVNLSQLKHERQTRIQAEESVLDSANKYTRNSIRLMNKNNEIKINELNNKVKEMNKVMKNGLASSAAISGLFQPYNIGKFNLTAGIGGYRDASAIAVGTGYRFNNNVAAKSGISTSTNDSSSVIYNASVNFEW